MNLLWWSLIAVGGLAVFLRLNPLWSYFSGAIRVVGAHRGKLIGLVAFCTAGWEAFEFTMRLSGPARFLWWSDFDPLPETNVPIRAIGDAAFLSVRPFFAIFNPVPCSLLVLAAVFLYPTNTAVPLWKKASARRSLWRGIGVVGILIILALLHLAGILSGLLGRGVLASASNDLRTGAARWLPMTFGFIAAIVVQMVLIRLFAGARFSNSGAAKADTLSKMLQWAFERIVAALPFFLLICVVALPAFLVPLTETGMLVYQAGVSLVVILPLCALQLTQLSGDGGIRESLRLCFGFWRAAWMPVIWFVFTALALLLTVRILSTWLHDGYADGSIPKFLVAAVFAFLTGLIHVWLLATWCALYKDHLKAGTARKRKPNSRAGAGRTR